MLFFIAFRESANIQNTRLYTRGYSEVRNNSARQARNAACLSSHPESFCVETIGENEVRKSCAPEYTLSRVVFFITKDWCFRLAKTSTHEAFQYSQVGQMNREQERGRDVFLPRAVAYLGRVARIAPFSVYDCSFTTPY